MSYIGMDTDFNLGHFSQTPSASSLEILLISIEELEKIISFKEEHP